VVANGSVAGGSGKMRVVLCCAWEPWLNYLGRRRTCKEQGRGDETRGLEESEG
jgi:hypothetical protein